MTTKKFITKNGLQTQNIDFTSPDETKLFPIALGNDGILSIKDGSTVLINIASNGSLQIPVATGTAPLVINSTTLVSNLNADLLDGQEGSFYTNASNLSSGTIGTARLGSGTADNTTYLRGDGTWAEVSGGSSGISTGKAIAMAIVFG